MKAVLSVRVAAPLAWMAPVVGERQMVASLENAEKQASETTEAMMLVLKNNMIRLEVEEDIFVLDAPKHVTPIHNPKVQVVSMVSPIRVIQSPPKTTLIQKITSPGA